MVSNRLLCILIITSAQACSQSDQFFCGTASDIQANAVRLCDRPTEVCICATYSCAAPTNDSACASGYRYVDEPFASSKSANQCVDSSELGTIIPHGDVSLCHPQSDAAVPDSAPHDSASAADGTNLMASSKAGGK